MLLRFLITILVIQMETNEITVLYQSLKKKLDKTQRQIDELREKCPHSEAIRIPKANTGNWD